ncbi:hypothetical protein [Psychrobacillus sp. MER TA 171]|uniref:hypothetical protein n=1 Tax=Psychrobacillus sp. MER TA 171 TaxID=2939577 RepID=UPI00203E9B39|nr:hypothetical protein [Psychrobacillus sp. MER TA 171]MCM3358099.1 hypothetical protein [Psychrobacillus sp. MER TA 171]
MNKINMSEFEASYRVYSSLKWTVNKRFLHFWGSFQEIKNAQREKIFAEDAVFISWIETGKLKPYEKEMMNSEEQ